MYKTLDEVLNLMVRGLERGYMIGIVYFLDGNRIHDIFYTSDFSCPIYTPVNTDIEIYPCVGSLKDKHVIKRYLLSNFNF